MIRSILVGGALLVLASCTGLSPTPVPSATPGQQPTGATAAPSNPPTLSGNLDMWHTFTAGDPAVSRGANAALGAALDVVRNENPGLSLSVTEVSLGELFITYQLQGASGTPDVVYAPNDNAGGIAAAGLSSDLSTAISPGELSRFAPIAVDASKVNGQLVQMPATIRSVAFYYRTDRVTSFPATTDELVTAIRDNGLKLGLYQSIYQVFGLWGSFGGTLMDSSGRCVADSTGVAQAFAYYAALKAAGATWYGPNAYDQMAADFRSGALDAVIDGPWAGDAYRDANPDTIAVAPLPAGPAGPAAPMVGVDGWTVNPHSANAELAIAFAKRMTQPDILAILSGQAIQVPADPAVEPADPLSAGFAAAAQAGGVPRPQVPQMGAFWGHFTDALNAVVDDGTDPEQAVAEACATMNSDNGL
ncbi:MAG TPA: extracellular solute-binding protein [Candidatus Limnocylindria bacterium]|nr:extracellular solute-binding protein [Candidatus Limnocylindria bacterium]